jgi:hypothetical protein
LQGGRESGAQKGLGMSNGRKRQMGRLARRTQRLGRTDFEKILPELLFP